MFVVGRARVVIMEFRVTKGELFRKLSESEDARRDKTTFINNVMETELRKVGLEMTDISKESAERITTKLTWFHTLFKRKWNKYRRLSSKIKKYESSLLAEIISEPIIRARAELSASVELPVPQCQQGRPSVPYEASSDRSKRRRVAETLFSDRGLLNSLRCT